MKRISQIVLLLSFMLLGAHQAFASTAGDNIIFSEVQYDPSGTEPKGEWFELYNPTAHPIDIHNWTFEDNHDTYQIPVSFILEPNHYYVFAHTASEFANEFGFAPDFEYGEGAFGVNIQLGNSGDHLLLKNTSGGSDIDFVAWEKGEKTNGTHDYPSWTIIETNGESIERTTSTDTDNNADWQSHVNPPTPGTGTLTMTNHAPDIISNEGNATATVHIDEDATAVTTVSANDPDNGDIVSYTISGGADQALFSIDANTGVLTFNTAPDFENPTDANSDGTYEINVQASDGFLQDTQAISVVVDDVPETPVITSAHHISIPENQTSVMQIVAHDEDGDNITYSLQGGPGTPDTNLFTIDPNTGDLSFINAPDFENPMDADTPAMGDQSRDNVYQVGIRATDDSASALYAPLLLMVTVTDIPEASPSHHHSSSRRISKKKLSEIFGKAKNVVKEEVKEEVKEKTTPKCGFTYSRLIKYGVHGEDVKALQEMLNSLGFNTGIADGWYGPKTFKGIKAFQTAMGIMQDGIVGPQSTAKLMQKCSA